MKPGCLHSPELWLRARRRLQLNQSNDLFRRDAVEAHGGKGYAQGRIAL